MEDEGRRFRRTHVVPVRRRGIAELNTLLAAFDDADPAPAGYVDDLRHAMPMSRDTYAMS